MATLLAVNADRTALDVALAVLSAPLLVMPRTETVALILTASGTTIVVPVALIVMNRVSTADAGAARPAPVIRVRAIAMDVKVRKRCVFIPLLWRTSASDLYRFTTIYGRL